MKHQSLVKNKQYGEKMGEGWWIPQFLVGR
jgi:hypothetical protein